MPELPSHQPVLLRAVTELLDCSAGRCIVDCTVGLGGHAAALLATAPADATFIGIDLDAGNLRRAKQRLEQAFPGRRMHWYEANFDQVREVLAAAGVGKADRLLADLGVASTQLDDAGRGLSFAADGPLDMRLGATATTAADLVNTLGEAELADLIWRLGEERFSRRIARAIVQARRAGRIERTGELAALVERAVGGRRGQKIHPATRTFQALRIAVNDELGGLERLLAALPDVLADGGRAAVISFHSLEDRRVKQAFLSMKSAGIARIITPKPIVADDEEKAANPRSRSAKLRCIERA